MDAIGDGAGYAMVAAARKRDLPTRVGLAAFIGAAAWLLAPSIWPVVWFAVMLAGQIVDDFAFAPIRRTREGEPSRAAVALACVSSALNTTIYSALALYLWNTGGSAGQLFAIVQVAGSLLHVSLHLNHARPILISAVIPHTLYFLGLPLWSTVQTGSLGSLVVVLAGLLYLTHLVVAVRQIGATTQALRAASAEAGRERLRAEKASAAKSDFLAVISHEIRTPMNAVISGANLLRRTHLTHDQREHVDMLIDAGDVLVGLLNDVLDFSKIEAGKMTLAQDDTDVRAKLASLTRLWRPKAEARGVRMTLDVADDVPSAVSTDALRLQQILFNLMSNAVKFTDEGRIAVRASWRAQPGVLVFEVEDTGCGIAPDRLQSVFDSFEQADAGTTRRYGGTGLGLAISRRLAQIMGGDLTAESEPGKGSLFRLILPVAVVAASAAPDEGPAASPAALAGRAILAADDHEVNRRILKLLLEPHGVHLTLVENGAEAVEAARLQAFDVIVLDMQMPVMDGLDAARAIRLGDVNGSTPIVALTANAMDAHRARWEAIGVDGFLTKPIDPQLLAETLAQAAAGRPALKEAV